MTTDIDKAAQETWGRTAYLTWPRNGLFRSFYIRGFRAGAEWREGQKEPPTVTEGEWKALAKFQSDINKLGQTLDKTEALETLNRIRGLMCAEGGRVEEFHFENERYFNAIQQALQQNQCPHIRTSKEGTSWCALAEQVTEKQARIIKSLENTAFRHGAMLDPPCFRCGYEGEGYFLPDTHPCAERHHELYRWRKSPAKLEQDG